MLEYLYEREDSRQSKTTCKRLVSKAVRIKREFERQSTPQSTVNTSIESAHLERCFLTYIYLKTTRRAPPRLKNSRSRGLELKEILLVQQRVANTLVVGPAANLRAVGEQMLLDKLAIDAW